MCKAQQVPVIQSTDGLVQHHVKLRENEKNKKLIDLLGKLQFNQVVIFVKSVPRCTALCELSTEQKFPSVEVHHEMPEEKRNERFQQFKNSKVHILVATDLFGHDADIKHADIIFNYDMPQDSNTYFCRVARGYVFSKKGLAITFIEDANDETILNKVQSRFELQITEMPDEIDVSTYMENRLLFGLMDSNDTD